MIYSITGELVYADPNMAAVNVNGIAFQCDISLNTFRTSARRARPSPFTPT
ncbi:MAG: hypothetical protein IIT43_02545 [Clostridia bacterium]|nr:hypothetical protein [Clostridia bacterium]